MKLRVLDKRAEKDGDDVRLIVECDCPSVPKFGRRALTVSGATFYSVEVGGEFDVPQRAWSLDIGRAVPPPPPAPPGPPALGAMLPLRKP